MLSNKRIQLIFAMFLLMLIPAGFTFAATPNIRQPIEDPSGQALNNFYQSLTRTITSKDSFEPNITRILHYGDSHVAADILTASLRRSFQRNFGDAGSGFILAGKPWPWYARAGVESGATSGWHSDGLGPIGLAEDRRFGLAGVSLTTELAGERVWIAASGSSFEIYFMKQPNGGSVELLLDGESYRKDISLAADDYQTAYLKIDAVTDRLHRIEIETTKPGLSRLFGFVAERNSSGVIYDALGINGARASRPYNWEWQLLSSNLTRRNPDLIVVAYGTNEVSDPDLDINEYRKNFTELLNRFHQAAPRASLLVIAPPDRAERNGRYWREIVPMPALIEAQRQAAFAAGAAFWDLYHGMGGKGSIDRWSNRIPPLAQPDHVHLTHYGYQLVADSLYTELTRGYLQSVWQSSWQNWWPILSQF